jgi:branched-chain amino acid transport system ATP-binding protein
MTSVLKITGVHKGFAGIAVLADFDLQLEDGALYGLVGTNGSGKTTVLNVIGGQEVIDAGCIRLAGRDISCLPTFARTKTGLGRIFQESRLWSDLTVREHLVVVIGSVGRGHPASRSLRDVLLTAELSTALLDQMPSQMRLLDRRRVELALAMLTASNLLLVDEIGAGLHIEEASALYQLIEQFVRQRRVRAALIVEHKLDLLAAFATEIGLISGGKIKERADCDQHEHMSRLIERMFDFPKRGQERDGQNLIAKCDREKEFQS